MEASLLREIVIIFCLSIVVIYTCSKVKIPAILGFLITGIVCGPYGLGLVHAVEQVEKMADIGVVFLLFTIGLENITIEQLVRLKKPVFFGGSVQVFVTIILFAAMTFFVGMYPIEQWNSAIFAGFVVSLSSTAIVLSCMQAKAEMNTPHGNVVLSVMLYQDVIVVPMMLAIPILAGHSATLGSEALLAALGTVVILGSSFFLGRKLVPWIMRKVIFTKIRELFLISTLGICLAIAYLTSLMGLSLALGAFLAGMIVAESEYSRNALEGIMPFKDVFTSLFFISVGMLLNTSFLLTHLWPVLLLTVMVMVVKTISGVGVGVALGYPLRTSLLVGFSICQIGEFSFVLAKTGLDEGLFTPDAYQIFLSAIILTMLLTPPLLNLSPKLAGGISRAFYRWRGAEPKSMSLESEFGREKATELSDHLIIIGYGVGGKHLSRAAKAAGIAYNILEMNPETVRTFRSIEPIMHGDATHVAVLEALGVRRARVLAIVISDPAAVRAVTELAARLNPSLHVLVRTRFLGEVSYLKSLGASDVVPEEFETSIEIFTRVLVHYLVPRNEIDRFTEEIRCENYDCLREVAKEGPSFGMLRSNIPNVTITAFGVEAGSPLEGVCLRASNLRPSGLTVVAVKRGAETIANPGADYCFAPGDIAYVFADHDHLPGAFALFRKVEADAPGAASGDAPGAASGGAPGGTSGTASGTLHV